MSVKDRLNDVFRKEGKILSVFITAGYPELSSTLPLCEAVEKAGAGMIEIGFPFSDPLADGEVIQKSSAEALKNGMSLRVLFDQLASLREKVKVPVLLMGYLNPVMQFGVEKFCANCSRCGIDGLIIPDLPLEEFRESWQPIVSRNNLHQVFLVTQSTSEERIRKIDDLSTSFIYAVSQPGVTGGKAVAGTESEMYLEKLASLKLNNPLMVGFGVSDRAVFRRLTTHAAGAIIGSAFIRHISGKKDYLAAATEFVTGLL